MTGRRERSKDAPEWWTTDHWATPPELVKRLEVEFGPFDLDVCARAETAKAPRFFTEADNGLMQPWRGKCWLNPPYSRIGPWLAKARWEVTHGRATVVVALLPASVDTGWWHDLVIGVGAEVRYVRGRVRFLGWQGTPIPNPKAASVLAVYRRRSFDGLM